jgi:hypothetical protein
LSGRRRRRWSGEKKKRRKVVGCFLELSSLRHKGKEKDSKNL